ncbi:hypothetical protein AB0M02_07405 [Actinoplanes sp. NPDC051861]|uniref:hypothetical protein n=1 Tax=Actinoplanes sp. NPDC051861 TaxID=3155170 RepID=UPI003443BE68
MTVTIDVDPDDEAITRLRNGYKPAPGESVIEQVPLGDGEYWVPRRFDLISTGSSTTPGWRMAVVVRHGIPLCQRITIESSEQEVRSVDLRALRVEEMLELATRYVAVPVERDASGRVRARPLALADVRAGVTLPAVRAARRRARSRITPSILSEVADVYRQHDGRSPTRAVQQHFGLVSERTARFWVKRSRDAGFLGKSLPGKGGEQQP